MQINSLDANDYLGMIQSVSFKHFRRLAPYGWQIPEIVSEMWISVKESLDKLRQKPAEKIVNIDGWVMRTMHNRITRLLNLEGLRIRTHLYVELVRANEVSEFQVVFLDYALEMAASMLTGMEKDVLLCLTDPPSSLQALMTERSREDKADKKLETIADYLGISYDRFRGIVEKIRKAVQKNILYEPVMVEKGVL